MESEINIEDDERGVTLEDGVGVYEREREREKTNTRHNQRIVMTLFNGF